MKNGEKYFILSNDLIHTVAYLPKEKAGELFMHILEFVNDKNPISEDPIVNLSFEPVKQALIADFEKKKIISSHRSDAGRRSAENRLLKKNPKKQQVSTSANKCQQMSTLVEIQKKSEYQEIIDIFNMVCNELPRARLTPEREKLIEKILKTYSHDEIGTVFRNTKESDYLNGKINGWKANFNWLLNPTNFIKVLEGNYANISDAKTESVQEQWKKADDAVNNYYK